MEEYPISHIHYSDAINFVGEQSDTKELDSLVSNLSTSCSYDEESTKEILTILNRKPRTNSSISLKSYNIKAPVPKKTSTSFIIERFSRPYNL